MQPQNSISLHPLKILSPFVQLYVGLTKNSRLFLISRPLTADIFEPRSRAYHMGGADGFDGRADRDGDMAQVHADQGIADVDSGVCLDVFHSAGMLKFIPRGGGEGTAGL